MTTTTRPSKGYYNEAEAARALDLSLEQFRALVRRHILAGTDEHLANLPMTSFQPCDLVVLRLLAMGMADAAAVAAPAASSVG